MKVRAPFGRLRDHRRAFEALPSAVSLFVAALFVFSGCMSTEPIILSLPHDLPSQSSDSDAPRSPCRIVIVAVKDERTNPESLGAVGVQPILADLVSDWVTAGLYDLVRSGHTVVTVGDGLSSGDIVAEIGIQSVYARNVVTQFEAIVALRAKLSAPKDFAGERFYRGSVTQLNWANGRGEITRALGRALAQAVRQIGEDVEKICREAKS